MELNNIETWNHKYDIATAALKIKRDRQISMEEAMEIAMMEDMMGIADEEA